jgi:hypothetical protein
LSRAKRPDPEPHPDRRICSAAPKEGRVAEISFTLKTIAKEIEKAEKKLRAIRGKVAKADQKKIDLELRGLVECSRIVKHFCRPLMHYGQTFRTESQKK